jgi:hypothetical protein
MAAVACKDGVCYYGVLVHFEARWNVEECLVLGINVVVMSDKGKFSVSRLDRKGIMNHDSARH